MVDNELEVNGSKYEYLATAYVLVPRDDKQNLADLEMELQTGLNENIKLKVPAAPIQRNYRTNVLGNLLTNQTDFTVEINADFYTPDNELTKVVVDSVSYTNFREAVAKALELNKSVIFIENMNARISLFVVFFRRFRLPCSRDTRLVCSCSQILCSTEELP